MINATSTLPPRWPVVGEKYIWELFSFNAVVGVRVMEVYHDGREWMVRTERVTCGGTDGKPVWNTLERFQEACLPYVTFKNLIEQFKQGQKYHEV